MRTFHKRSIKAALIGSAAAVAIFGGADAASANVWTYQGTYYTPAACQSAGHYGVAHYGWTSYACNELDSLDTPPRWLLYSFD